MLYLYKKYFLHKYKNIIYFFLPLQQILTASSNELTYGPIMNSIKIFNIFHGIVLVYFYIT